MNSGTKKDQLFWVPKVKSIMKKRGITLDDLAEAMDVKPRGAVGHYLSGRRKMTIDRMVVLANTVGIDIKEMIEDPHQRAVREAPAGYGTEHNRDIPFVFMCPLIPFVAVPSYMNGCYSFSQGQEFVSIAKKGSNKTFAVQLVSESMMKNGTNDADVVHFIPQDIVIFDPAITPEVDDYVLCQEQTTGEFLFRQLCAEGSKFFLRALNAQYNRHISYKIEEVKVIAVAVARLNILK